MTDLPIVDEATVDSIFREIESMNVALDNDPIEFGPKRLNNKVAESRDHLTRCEQLFVRVSHWLQLYKRAHRAAQLDFDLAMQDMLANDPEVRAGRNVKDRDAIATVKMRERREELDRLAITIQDLEALMTVIKSKRTDLKDSQGRLKDQIRLCQEEVGLGAKWGSRAGNSTQILDSAPAVDAVTMRDINALLEGKAESDLGKIQPKVVAFEKPEPPSSDSVFAGKGSESDLGKIQPKVVAFEKPAPLPVNDAFKGTSGDQSDLDALLEDVDPSEPAKNTDVSIDDLLDFI